MSSRNQNAHAIFNMRQPRVNILCEPQFAVPPGGIRSPDPHMDHGLGALSPGWRPVRSATVRKSRTRTGRSRM